MGETWLVDHLLKKGANPCHKTKLSGALPSTFASECSESCFNSFKHVINKVLNMYIFFSITIDHLRVKLMLERAEITYRSY